MSSGNRAPHTSRRVSKNPPEIYFWSQETDNKENRPSTTRKIAAYRGTAAGQPSYMCGPRRRSSMQLTVEVDDVMYSDMIRDYPVIVKRTVDTAVAQALAALHQGVMAREAGKVSSTTCYKGQS
jgi:hypothetical protein